MSGAELAVHQQIKKRKELKFEEENMSHILNNDMITNWEFKIVRSATNAFKNPLSLAKVLQQESVGGWELFEKLDDNRLRLKRPITTRENDGLLPRGYNPYRSKYGISEGAIGMIIAGILLFLALIGFTISALG